jgi:hypothetical protein
MPKHVGGVMVNLLCKYSRDLRLILWVELKETIFFILQRCPSLGPKNRYYKTHVSIEQRYSCCGACA